MEDVLKPPGSLLLIVLRRCFWYHSYFILFGVVLYFIVSDLYVSGSGSITSVGEERANLSAIVYL